MVQCGTTTGITFASAAQALHGPAGVLSPDPESAMRMLDTNVGKTPTRRAHAPARLLLSLLLLVPALPLWAQNASFAVGARVQSSQPAPQALADLPLPPATRQMSAHVLGGSYYFAGDARAAAAFYRTQMALRGYRLHSASGSAGNLELVWESAQARVQLQLRQALGANPATRIVVRASAA